MDIPYSFIITTFNHNSNLTEGLRKVNKNNKLDFYKHWDDEFQMFVDMLRDSIINNSDTIQ